MARILYGVQGEGRGHATRSLHVLQALIHEGHEVLVLTGGDALPVLAPVLGNRVLEIPLLRYHYDARGALSPWRTVLRNVGPFLRMGFRNAALDAAVRRFRPAAVVSDFEPLTCRLARVFRLPLVAVDHQHFLTESVLPRMRGLRNAVRLAAYRLGVKVLSGWPRRVLVSSFRHFPKKRGSRALFIGPFLSEDVRRVLPRAGRHVTVYLKRPESLQAVLPALALLPERDFEVFSSWETEWAHDLPRHVRLRPVSRQGFIDSLSSCHALLTTAGNQVLGEAIWLGKPALALPETGVIEQAFNARALDESGCGMACGLKDFTPGVWGSFEENRAGYLRVIHSFRDRNPDYDGLATTLRVIRRLVKGAPPRTPVQAPEVVVAAAGP